MHPIIIAIDIITDSLTVLALLYMVFIIMRADQKFVKSQLTLQYERFQRDKVFQKALFILALAFLVHVHGVGVTYFNLSSDYILNWTQAISSLLQVIFVAYVIRIIQISNHKE